MPNPFSNFNREQLDILRNALQDFITWADWHIFASGPELGNDSRIKKTKDLLKYVLEEQRLSAKEIEDNINSL